MTDTKVQKSNLKPLKRSVSFTNGFKSGSKFGSKFGKINKSGGKSMKFTKSSSKSSKKIKQKSDFDSDQESSDKDFDDNESDRDESDSDNSSDNDELDSEESDSDELDSEESDSDECDSDESDSDESDNDESDNDESDSDKSKKKQFNPDKKINKEIIKNGDPTSLKNIMISQINDEYYLGQYGSFEVIIMAKNDYINVTKLCSMAKSKNGKSKLFIHWKETADAQELITEVSSAIGMTISELLVTIQSGNKNLTITRGTYAHPKLVPHIAAWASKKFAVMVSDIINEHFAKKMFYKHEQLIKGKDDKIDELSKKIDKQTKIMKNQTNMMKDQKSTIKEQDKKINELLYQSNKLMGYSKDTNRKITHVVKERVPYSDEPKIEHQLIIMKNNDKIVKPKKGEKVKKIYDYTALRIMNKSKSATMNRYFKDHPDGETVLTIDYTPNAMHLWNQCKIELIEDDKIKPSGTSCSSFNLKKGYSENKLKKDVKRIHNLRLKHPE
ncbi:kila N-terminal domain N1R/P28 DNA binding protein [Acanthamoeba polyphaga mimivirus]|uniref:Kila N-terminal domain N1R/P28 DNA binding protein n=1 Tax=Acanthamoeba polyphaga mimivirus Kroon TaxID=3069720 RepID=A0A0G2Y9T6_9VIRU|nr:kila N-terminal domain N1R/P28 DNA binding protein [Acanthamoeba polyphaga mimivirus]AKI80607.1 kila N-terminal domain N1R/P28 DNA binding protein [Acanthamoeba polyphaga mimivirus Kroon]